MKKRRILWVFSVLAALALFCAKKEKTAAPAGDWAPEVTLSMGQSFVKKPDETEGKLARIGGIVEPGDLLLTRMESKMEVRLNSQDVLVVGEDSKVILQSTMNDKQPVVVANLFFGKLFSRIKKITASGKGTYRVVTPTATAAIRGTDFSVEVDPDTKRTMVMVAEGTVVLEDRKNGKSVEISAGSVSAVEKGKAPEVPRMVEKSQWDSLKSWVEEGSDLEVPVPASDAPVSAVPAAQPSAPIQKNRKPIFKTVEIPDLSLGEELRVTLAAEDPEGKALIYALLQGPEGCGLDSLTGEIVWKPDRAGTFTAKIRISNGSENSVRTFVIRVKGGMEVSVQASPTAGGTETDFFFNAAVGGADVTDNIQYAWDFENDGTIDLDFSAQSHVTHRFNRPGRREVRLIAKNATGVLMEGLASVTLNDPPRAVIKLSPSQALPGVPLKMDASASRDRSDSTALLKFRWDFEGDGKWDEPKTGFSSRFAIASHAYLKAGEYKVVVEAEDPRGAIGRDSAWARILGNVTAQAGEDLSGSVNAMVQFKGIGQEPEGKIAKYEWDFNGDGKFDWSSVQNGETSTTYKKEGNYSAVFRVTSLAGVTGVDTLRVTIGNAPPKAFTEKSKRAIVNSAVEFDGAAKDPDGKIAQYRWDFDGDGQFDFASDSTGHAVHTYTRAGSYNALFKVISADGKSDSVGIAVEVTNRPPEALAGEDVVSQKGKTVMLKGQGKDEDGSIVQYEWDFEADGKFDWANAKSGSVKHKFNSYGYAVLRVTDADGAQGLDTVRMVICPKGMATIAEKKLCVDQYEWPNREGNRPLSGVTWEQARDSCAQAGKRLCSSDEWTAACRGAEERNFPYGHQFLPDACNTKGQTWAKNKGVNLSGKFPECRTAEGVFDMSGNLMEWTDAKAPNGQYARGGSFENPMDGADCTAQAAENPEKGYFFVGFRCCK